MTVLGVGLDLVEVARVTRLWATHGERAARRLLTQAEWRYCASRADPSRHVAARLAAKEAAFKALAGDEAAGRIGWLDLEITREDDGRPVLLLCGAAALRARQLGVTRTLLTLTHTDTTAGAVVVLLA